MKKPMSVEQMTSMLEGKKKVAEDAQCEVCGEEPCECEEEYSEKEKKKKPSIFNEDSKKSVSILISLASPKKGK